MTGQIVSKIFCICVLGMLVGCPFFAVSSLLPYNMQSLDLQNDDTLIENDLLDSLTTSDSRVTNPFDFSEDTLDIGDNPNTYDPNPFFDQFKSYSSEIQSFTTDYLQTTGSGYKVTYRMEDTRLFITATIGNYDIVSYIFDEGTYDSVQIGGTEVSASYGAPALPYKNLILSIPDDASILSTEVLRKDTRAIYGLDVLPGPEPLAVSSIVPSEISLWFDPLQYSSNDFLPSETIHSTEVGIAGQPALYLTLYPLQYNPSLDQGNLALQMEIEVTFDRIVSLSEVVTPPESQFGYEVGGNYVVVVDSTFVSAVTDFVDWKTSIGWDVSVRTVQDIYALYSGRDNAEDLRDFIVDEYTTNGTLYYLLVGDGDIVPAREVWDPMDAGMGLDNGTEASDLYFECLDGDWDSNGNDLFGEMDDTVDLFPEVSVGRLPVQTPAQAEHTLAQIISIESNPEPGSWIDDFMLIAPDCFGYGDGVNMVEEVLNQKHLIGSFFDVDTFYPTDGSLSNAAVVSRINAGVGLIDFFDHGAYDVWVGALTVAEALGLTNGDKAAFAFGMACETAAFDAESVEPTIGEAFFRAPSGGYHTYIAATRIAWAGYHCFDGFHHRFWDQFFADIFDDRVANPKSSMMAALYEMATVFDVSVGTTRETIYHAIYFGDPTIHMSWKQDVTTDTTSVGINEEVTVDGTCLQFQSGIPLSGDVNITVKDPIGRVVYEGSDILDGLGEYSVSFFTNELSGNYTVETSVWDPFVYTEETEFYVGDSPITLSLDSTPTYHANLSFSGTSPFDGTGTARVSTLEGLILGSIPVTSSGGVFSGDINITRFGWLNLHVMIDSGSEQSGLTLRFKVSHGDILIISDNTGGYGPDYPGGWPSSNYGDSTNFGEIREALEDEYEITEWRLLFNGTPSISYLHQFDAVLVSMGDAYAEPLTCADSFIIDILQQYHDEGGNLLFEGGSFLTQLQSSYSAYYSSLFHVSYTTSHTNTGSLYLDSGGHPITSGLPSSLFLEDGLGSANVDVFSPIGDSQHVSGYSGSYAGGTAISALPAIGSQGAVVTLGFAIDAIQNEDLRYKLVQNAVGFLLHPTLTVLLSDYAIPYGSSETVWFTALEASTGTPVAGAEISLTGCGVIATNMTKADGTCSLFVNPSSFGEIAVDVSKAGFLNYSTTIIIYDKPIVSVLTDPLYAEKGVTQTLTVIATEYYEGTPLEGCAVNLTGCGVSVVGTTNSSGLLDLAIHPTIGGRMLLNVTLSGYVNSTTYVGVPINVAVLRSFGTMYPEDFAWEELNTNWNAYGDVPVIIDYTSLDIYPFTLTDLESTGADVLVVPFALDPYTIDEVNAIISYVEQGHGLVTSSTTLSYSPDGLASFLGVSESLSYSGDYVPSMDILDGLHPIMNNVANPYVPGEPRAFYPIGTGWDESILDGAEILAIDSSGGNYGAILTYRGMVYFSNYAPLLSNAADYQIFYNALTWSDYIIPEHDLSARLETTTRAEPGDTIYVNATVRNQGIYDESDVVLRLFIDGVEVDNLTIPTLVNGTTQTFTYVWTPIVEKIYNVTAFVDIVADEYSYSNNDATTMVDIRPIQGWILWDESHYNGQMLEHTSYIEDLEYEGYVVEAHTSGDVTSAVLSGYDVLVCAEFGMEYAPSELIDIQNFVMDGGGLLVMGDNSVYLRNALTSYAGIEWIGGSYGGIATDITSHPVTENVSTVYFGGASNVLLTSGTAISLVRFTGLELVAVSEYGFGYIVAICDDHFLDDGDYENLDNPTMGINIMDWMSMGRADHDIVAMLEVPTWIEPDEEVIVNASVFNRGLNDELDVTLGLYIDGLMVDSMFVPFIQNGTSATLTYHWTPTIEAIYNVTVYVEPVFNETLIANNHVERMISVAELTLLSDFEYADHGFLIEGLWHRVDDSEPFGISHSPTHSMWYGQDDTGDYKTNGSNFGSLLSRPFLLGSNVIALNFWSWYETEESSHSWDVKEVYVILPDSSRILLGYVSGTMNTWIEYTMDISAFADTVVQFAFFFDTFDDIANDYRGWYVDDISVIGSVTPFDHDLQVTVEAPADATIGSSNEITAILMNWGTESEFNLDLRLYLDDILIESVFVASLGSLETYTLQYFWMPGTAGLYNITAYVVPVAGEVTIENNVDTKFTDVSGARVFSIIEPTSGATVEGGLVYIAFEWDGPTNPGQITIYVNSVNLADIPYYPGNNHLFAPIFQNGTNLIELEIYWTDSVITSTSVSIESENVVPLIAPVAGDEVNYRIEQSGMLMDYNFTFTGFSFPFMSEVAFELAHLDPSTGAIISSYTYYFTVNILNGYIVDGGEIGWTGTHLFWMTGIDALIPMQSFADIGDHGLFFGWSDVFTIVDNSTWNGHPSWILESSSIYNYVVEALMLNGLLVDLEDVTMGLHLYLTYSSFVPEPDTTPPEWVVEPSDYTAECGVSFAYQLQASDNYNYITWSVNDTVHFDIDSAGVLGNSVFLAVGSYPVEVTVTDAYLNSISASFVVEVVDTLAPIWIVPPSDVTLEFSQNLTMQLVATDWSGIASWSVNDTTNFEIDTTGLVTNINPLTVGTYDLTVTVVDIYGNTATESFTVTVTAATTGTGPPGTMVIIVMVIIGMVGGVVVFIIIRIIMSRRRGG